MNTYLLKLWFQVTTLTCLKKMFKVSTMIFHASNKKKDFWEPTLFQQAWLGLLQVVEMQTMIQLWFMHYGAPPSTVLAIPKFMNNVFPEQWIAQSKPIARPDRCADFKFL
jgi:hypothetical protein